MIETPLAALIRANPAPYRAFMQKMCAALAEIDWSAIKAAVDRVEGHDAYHPRPLCIDGHAYHQRRRNRRKR